MALWFCLCIDGFHSYEGVLFFSSMFQEPLSFGMFSLVCYHDLAVEVQILVSCFTLLIGGIVLSYFRLWAFGLNNQILEFA